MEFDKLVVYDDRVVPLKNTYAVMKGGSAITSSQNNAISSSNSQHLFTVNPPSDKCFVDRKVSWSSDVFLRINVAAIAAGVATAGSNLLTYGRDIALCAYPLHEMCSNVSVNINNQQTTFNCSEYKNEILRLVNLKDNLSINQTPSMLDNCVTYSDMTGTLSNVLASYNEAIPLGGDSPNGAHSAWWFTRPDGTILTGNGTYPDNFGAGVVNVQYTNGVPVVSSPLPVANFNGQSAFWLYVKFSSRENLMLPPFVFNDIKKNHESLFGVSTMKFVCNISGPTRVIRNDITYGRIVSGVAFNPNKANSAFEQSAIHAIYITPPLSLPLPQKAVVPHTEFIRYTGQVSSALAAGAQTTSPINSGAIQLSGVPDMLLIYAKPLYYNNIVAGGNSYTWQETDWHLVINSLELAFDNRSGMCTTYDLNQLYELSVANGLDNCDWYQFYGTANTSAKGKIATAGPLICLRPGKDFELPVDVASGCGGKYEISVRAQVYNQAPFNVANVQLNIIAVNSGFFVCQNGTAMVNLNPLTMEDVVNPDEPVHVTQSSIQRYVGGGIFNNFANLISKGASIYNKTKPLVSAVKELLPESGMRSALSAVGYGKKGKKSIASRLM